MSQSLQPTVATVPDLTQIAAGMLALMTALSGINTDTIPGSQIRTQAESIGAVAEEEGIANQALALEALAYGAMSLFGVSQSMATAATGVVTFATAPPPVSAAPVAPQAVFIPSGTLVQTAGGVQFVTIANTVLASGTASVNVGAIASQPGTAGNVTSGAITGLPLSSIGYPLYVTNGASMTGGANAGTQSQALAQFTSKSQALGLVSPIAVANAVIGVLASGTGEMVEYSSAYEPWIAAGSGAGSGTAGFGVYIDNGTGSASNSLIAAVIAFLNGSVTLNEPGARPIGVPYYVSGVTPVFAVVSVSGVLVPGLLTSGTVAANIVAGVDNYFGTIGFSPAAAYQPSIAGSVADAAAGAFESLAVSLFVSGSSSSGMVVSGGFGTRVVLASLSVNLTTASN